MTSPSDLTLLRLRLKDIDVALREMRVDLDEAIELGEEIAEDLEAAEEIAGPAPAPAGPLPLTFRNNNPGALRPTAAGKARWRGEIDTSNGYAMFVDNVHGTRALLYLLRLAYFDRLGLDTLRKILDRFAPDFDNSAASRRAYLAHLCESCGLAPDDPIDLHDSTELFCLAMAISQFESGRDTTPLTDDGGIALLNRAYAMLPLRPAA